LPPPIELSGVRRFQLLQAPMPVTRQTTDGLDLTGIVVDPNRHIRIFYRYAVAVAKPVSHAYAGRIRLVQSSLKVQIVVGIRARNPM
jgi:hypothetical protein